ncbi:hypothetical protein K505DRAFT_265305 [Melanomma pulvis-pyrius CBS 109.77]|uniref:Zn(2)-C6 fungal-type domain-containing protein n=1 Tax=Melanomma pulvis-pyrius CBS 109.77 TaxID=1314802 RepID=A0A6A6XUF2_9PLEO|nr:hypothetical protein K505DRAFT_265305 [Melanomma pulvis-pyrius CBS 109.77]
MATRRSHRKSRSGCKECKRRRIKCNEDKPQCTNCIRHGIACVYLKTGAPQPEPSPSESSPLPSHSTSCTFVGTPPQVLPRSLQNTSDLHQPHPLFELGDLALLHHWCLVTSLTFGSTADVSLWQMGFPKVAFRHPFLMHGILSLAALHVAYLNPSSRRSSMLDAAQHHSKSLQGFRQGIDQMSEKNSEALFITSAFTFLYAFVTFGTLHSEFEEGANSATRTLRVLGADWIPLVRGVSTVLKPTYESLKRGPFSCLFEMGNWDNLNPDDVSGPEDKEILRLQEIWKGGEDAAVYDKTLYLLRKYCAWVKQFQPNRDDSPMKLKYNQDCSGPFIWASLSPEQYFKLLHQRQPSALIIFAYFGAVLNSLDRYWWMEGCGKSIVGAVDECLGPYWTPFLEWPKKTVGLD